MTQYLGFEVNADEYKPRTEPAESVTGSRRMM